ncbi:MAG: hypothetical protein JSR47_15330 [Proteobacteria bacterium]|nr:hypothetical protein [Pseudomonadota bacterium]
MRVEWDDFVAGVYDAALDSALWPSLLDAAVTRFGGAQAIVYTPDVAPNAGGFMFSHDIAPEWIAAYEQHYRPLDVWMNGYHERFEGRSGAFTGDGLVAREELVRTEFYNDFVRPQGLDHLCTSVIYRAPNAGSTVSMAMFRGPAAGAFEEEARLFYERLAPHLQRALLISSRLGTPDRERRIDAAMLDVSPVAIFLVDGAGRVARMTAAAEELVTAGTLLRLRANRLQTVDGSAALADAIREVAAEKRRGRFSRVLAVGGDDASRRVHLLVATAGMHLRGHAFVAVGPLGTADSAGLDARLLSAYRLTPAEIRLCELLAGGRAVNEAADLLAIKRSTAVTQLASIFRKTDCRRQSDLVRLLSDIAATGRIPHPWDDGRSGGS